jgi:hypothetical protein
MAIDKSDPFKDLPRGGNMARRIVDSGAARNIRANMKEGMVEDIGLRDELSAVVLERDRLKVLLSQANTRVLELEGQVATYRDQAVSFADRLSSMTADRDHWKSRSIEGSSPAEEGKPWEALGISRRTYYNRKRDGKL